MHRRIAALASAIFASVASAAGPATAPSPAEAYDAAFLKGDTQLLWEHASPELRKAIGSPDKFASLRNKLLGDRPTPVDETTTLARTVRTAAGETLVITYTTAADGTLIGLLIRPAPPATEAPSKFLDYRTKADVRLPFDGTWSVAWGGRTLKQNYHAAAPDQRFAYDLLIKKGNTTHAGDGTKNGDYFCYGRPILSPAAGTVVSATDDRPDNAPGQMDPAHAMGNHVVLDLGNHEYLFLCHFQPRTLKVKPGDAVTAGQPLALCGNSGNSSEPHLHIHLQDTPTPFQGAGLPLQLRNYAADGKAVDRGEPTRDQQIRPAG